MIENILTARNASFKSKLSVKSVLSIGIITLSVVLPQLIHLALGRSGGIQWMPMYMPVLIGGCLMGARWGTVIGAAAPIASFIITSSMENPMPSVERLPFMLVELAVFAAVSGFFSRRIYKSSWISFPAVLLAQVCGRAAFLFTVFMFQSSVALTVETAWQQIRAGFAGMLAQAVIVPFIIIGLKALLNRNKSNE